MGNEVLFKFIVDHSISNFQVIEQRREKGLTWCFGSQALLYLAANFSQMLEHNLKSWSNIQLSSSVICFSKFFDVVSENLTQSPALWSNYHIVAMIPSLG